MNFEPSSQINDQRLFSAKTIADICPRTQSLHLVSCKVFVGVAEGVTGNIYCLVTLIREMAACGGTEPYVFFFERCKTSDVHYRERDPM